MTPRDSQGVARASVSMTGRTGKRQLRIGRAAGTGGLTASGLEPGGGTFGQRRNGLGVIIYTVGSKSVIKGRPEDHFCARNQLLRISESLLQKLVNM